MLRHGAIAIAASLLGFSLIVGSGFSVWIFTDIEESHTLSGETSITPLALLGDFKVLPPDDYTGYRLIYSQGGSDEGDFTDSSKGIYLNTPIKVNWTNYNQRVAQTLFCTFSVEAAASGSMAGFSAYAELVSQTAHPSGMSDAEGTLGNTVFYIDPVFKWQEGKKPTSSSAWSTMMSTVRQDSLVLNMEFSYEI